MEGNSKKTLLMVVIGIVAFIAVVSLIILIKEGSDNTNVSNITTNDSKTNQTEVVEKTKEININDPIVAKLYKYILQDNSNCVSEEGRGLSDNDAVMNASFYKDTKVTYGNLNNIEKIITVIQSFEDKEANSLNVIKQSEVVFGNDASDIKWSNLVSNGTYYEYDNGAYTKKSYNEKSNSNVNYFGRAAITKVEQSENYVYIYDVFIYIEKFDDGDVKYYTSSQMSKEASGKDLAELNEYKHTFKKGEDGSYHWISTEISK